jgi:hypothetical protein
MKQYLLKNKTTNEEVLCNKVVVDGFDYYVIDFINKIGMYINEYGKPIVKYIKDLDKDLIWESIDGKASACDSKFEFKTVIATNNSSIDIPKVIDETFTKSFEYFVSRDKCDTESMIHFSKGYNTHASTHTLSDDEVVDFVDYCLNKHSLDIIGKYSKVSSKELLQLFKEQQIKTIYYNE